MWGKLGSLMGTWRNTRLSYSRALISFKLQYDCSFDVVFTLPFDVHVFLVWTPHIKLVNLFNNPSTVAGKYSTLVLNTSSSLYPMISPLAFGIWAGDWNTSVAASWFSGGSDWFWVGELSLMISFTRGAIFGFLGPISLSVPSKLGDLDHFCRRVDSNWLIGGVPVTDHLLVDWLVLTP